MSRRNSEQLLILESTLKILGNLSLDYPKNVGIRQDAENPRRDRTPGVSPGREATSCETHNEGVTVKQWEWWPTSEEKGVTSEYL
jgi:hypothetical protein